MRIRPEAPQNLTYTLVLAHLARGALPRVRPDRNLAEDFVDPTFWNAEADATTSRSSIANLAIEPASQASELLNPEP